MMRLRGCVANSLRNLSDEPVTRPKIRRPPYRTKKPSAGKWLMLGVPVATFCLGTWQVQRRSWKNELIETINRKTSGDAKPLPNNIHAVNWKELEYSKFVVTGEFDHSKELHVQPRTLVTPKDHQGGGSLISSRPRVGAHVVTPFYIPERGYSILVNRGFVDRDRINPETRPDGQAPGVRIVTGILRVTEKNKMMPSNDVEKNIWGTVDVERMAEVTGTNPILIEATEDCTVPGGPIAGQTRIRLWNQHFSYIITWYSLSAITLVMWLSKYLR